MIARSERAVRIRSPFWRGMPKCAQSENCLHDTAVTDIRLDTTVLGDQMNISNAKFSSSQVAKAAGMTAINFRAHLSRGNWRIIGDSKAAETFGKGHEFTLEDALGYALAHQLVSCGIEPKVAFDRAMYDFAHVGSVTDSFGGHDRNPGDVFDEKTLGYTLYVYCPGAERGQCVATNDVLPIELMFNPSSQLMAPATILINLNALRNQDRKSVV